MADIRTSIVIEARAGEAAKVVQDLRKQFGQLGQAAKDADAGGGQINRTRTALQSISSQLSQLRSAFVALQSVQAAGQGLRSVFATADAYTNLSARLRLATSGQAEFNAVFGALRDLADRTLAPLQETAQTYTRLAPAVKNLGGGFRETLGLVEAVTLSLRISGASAEEQASGLLQFAQGLQSNFQGDEFRALTENAPRLLQAVADGLGRSVTELKGLSSAGKLTADVVSNALLKSLQQLRSEAGSLPVTVGGAFQVLQNAALEYVGSTDQARGSSRALANVVLDLARNFKTLADALTLVVAALAALGIGRLVAALAGLVTTGGAVAGVFTRILALLGGPVGLIASLAAAALGFVAFTDKSARGVDDLEGRIKKLRDETAALRRENEALTKGEKAVPAQDAALAVLEQARAKVLALGGRGNESFREREIARIDREIAARSKLLEVEGKATAERDAELAKRGQLGQIAEPAKSIEDATKGLATRSNILREFEQRSKDINNAFSAAFKRALEEGNADRAREVLAQQREAQAAAAKDRDNALAGLAPPTRVPQLRQEFDASFALLKDRLEREKEALDLSLKDQLISIRGYFDERRRIADEESQAEIAKLEGERAQQQRFLDELQRRRQQAKPDQREQFDEQIFGGQQKVLEINTQIQIAQSRRIQEGRKLAFEQTTAERELAAALAEVRDRLAEIAGGGGDAVRERLQRQFEPLLKQLRSEGNSQGVADVTRLIDVEAARADLQKLEAEFNAALQRMRNTEQSINIQREAGLLSESAARQDILKLHRETADAVDGLIPRMQKLAEAIPGEESKNRVGSMRVEFERLKVVVDDVAVAVNSAVRDAFQGLFEDIARGSKSAKQIMLDFFRSIEQSITRIASQKLADQLFGGSGSGGFGGAVSRVLGFGFSGRGSNNASSVSFENSFDNSTTGGGGGPVGFLSSILPFFFHSGGVAGEPAPRRPVPLRVFAGAPRLHSGGIPGLAPGEVPTILQEGEEVLTRRDPRHRRNGGGMPPLVVNIQTQDVGSFMRSRGQWEAELASAAARGQRLR